MSYYRQANVNERLQTSDKRQMSYNRQATKDKWAIITQENKDKWAIIIQENKDKWAIIIEENTDKWAIIDKQTLTNEL